MVVWGGYNGYIGQMYGDGARYDLSTNTWLSVSGNNAPNQRYFHTAVWTGSEMIVWGGINYPVYDLSGGRYNPTTDTWTPTSLVNPPSLRWMHAAAWTGTEMIIQGGTPGNPVGGRYNPATDTWKSTIQQMQRTTDKARSLDAPEMILWVDLRQPVFHTTAGA